HPSTRERKPCAGNSLSGGGWGWLALHRALHLSTGPRCSVATRAGQPDPINKPRGAPRWPGRAQGPPEVPRRPGGVLLALEVACPLATRAWSRSRLGTAAALVVAEAVPSQGWGCCHHIGPSRAQATPLAGPSGADC